MHAMPLQLNKVFDLLDNVLTDYVLFYQSQLIHANFFLGGGRRVKLSWQQVPERNNDICQCQLHLQDF